MSLVRMRADWSQMLVCVSDNIENCESGLFQDASFAGDSQDSKSTSGGIRCNVGGRSFVPISWMCQKPNSISRNSPDAEFFFF